MMYDVIGRFPSKGGSQLIATQRDPKSKTLTLTGASGTSVDQEMREGESVMFYVRS